MKTLLKLFTLLLFCSLNTHYSLGQDTEFNFLRITRISFIQNKEGSVEEQLQVDLTQHTLYHRKRVIRSFESCQSSRDISLLTDLEKLTTLISISKNEACTYHNEYGYLKLELLKLDGNDEIYGITFLLNQPYSCQDEENRLLAKSYYDLINALFNEF